MDILYFILQNTLIIAIPLLIVALAGVFSERSGIINISLEGTMLFGAFFGILTMYLIQETSLPPQIILIIGALTAMIFGFIFSLLLSFAAINMKANQNIVGIALNMLVPAAVLLFSKMYFMGDGITTKDMNLYIQEVPILSKIPVIGDILFKNTYLTSYIGIILFIIGSIFLYKTKTGLRLRACGEHPQAADSVGINVYKMRYLGVSVSGALAGIGGYFYAVQITSSNINGHNGVAGYGFLALAVMIFGQWKPIRIIFSGLLFAFLGTFATTYSLIPFFNNLGLSTAYYRMLPYVVTLVVLIFTSKRSRAPKAEGQIYDKAMR